MRLLEAARLRVRHYFNLDIKEGKDIAPAYPTTKIEIKTARPKHFHGHAVAISLKGEDLDTGFPNNEVWSKITDLSIKPLVSSGIESSRSPVEYTHEDGKFVPKFDELDFDFDALNPRDGSSPQTPMKIRFEDDQNEPSADQVALDDSEDERVRKERARWLPCKPFTMEFTVARVPLRTQ